MWQTGWFWLKSLRKASPRARPDPADMGIEIGLDESLESRLPPLLEFAALNSREATDGIRPLGTDHRSRFA